jgi:hypothetical protein
VNLLTFPRSLLVHKLQARNSKIRRRSPIQTSGYTLGADLEIHVSVRSECTIDRVELQRACSRCLYLHPALKGLVKQKATVLRLPSEATSHSDVPVDFAMGDGLE